VGGEDEEQEGVFQLPGHAHYAEPGLRPNTQREHLKPQVAARTAIYIHK
jgi:hypothetical protein